MSSSGVAGEGLKSDPADSIDLGMGMHGTASLASKRLGLSPDAPDDPLDDIFLDYLLAQSRETEFWDFKRTLPLWDGYPFAKLAKHLFAFSNIGGGWIVLGVEETETGAYEPVGLSGDFHLDQANLQEAFNAYIDEPVRLGYREFTRMVEGEERKFAAIFVPPARRVLKPEKEGRYETDSGKQKVAFDEGEVLLRRGTQSDTASESEIEFIKERLRESRHVISLASGEPDMVSETLTSNLFPVTELPPYVCRVEEKESGVDGKAQYYSPCVSHGGYLYSFVDPRETDVSTYIRHSTVELEPIEDWLNDPERRRRLVWLLKQTVKWLAFDQGLEEQAKSDRLYYPADPEKLEKHVEWEGVHRPAERKVVGEMYAEQFGKEILIHEAVGIDFVWVGDTALLQLDPTFIGTFDGKRAIKDPRMGSVITKLLYDQFNDTFRRDVHFWVEQLQTSPDVIRTPDGELAISTTPVTADVEVGIYNDRPASRSGFQEDRGGGQE